MNTVTVTSEKGKRVAMPRGQVQSLDFTSSLPALLREDTRRYPELSFFYYAQVKANKL